MKTITLNEPGKLIFSQTPEPPAPAPGEALVRVHRVGVCGTDYHAYRGRQPFFTYPRILGHELGVEVVELNDGGMPSGLKPGDKMLRRAVLELRQVRGLPPRPSELLHDAQDTGRAY